MRLALEARTDASDEGRFFSLPLPLSPPALAELAPAQEREALVLLEDLLLAAASGRDAVPPSDAPGPIERSDEEEP